MGTDEKKLSERLLEHYQHLAYGGPGSDPQDLVEAARIVAAFEQAGPKVEELLERARIAEANAPNSKDPARLMRLAGVLRAHAADSARLERARALIAEWRAQAHDLMAKANTEFERGDPNATGVSMDGSWVALDGCANQLEAALNLGKEAPQ